MSVNIEELTQRALQVKNIYNEQSKKAQGKTWTAQDFAQGFVGDVGDLQKLVMAKAGLRNIKDMDAKLRHELSDCLWSVLILANEYNIDLEDAFEQTMQELEKRLEG